MWFGWSVQGGVVVCICCAWRVGPFLVGVVRSSAVLLFGSDFMLFTLRTRGSVCTERIVTTTSSQLCTSTK